MEYNPQVEVGRYTEDSGRSIAYERYRRSMPISAFEHSDRFKAFCEGCPKQGKSLSCPPHSPSLTDHIGTAGRAVVVCIRLPQAHFSALPPQDRYHACFKQASRLLVAELQRYRQEGRPIAGSGPCLGCERCSMEEGIEICRNPDERTYSLESLGVNVVGLLKASFDMELEWNTAEKNSEHISAVGAAFLP